jgi:AcrR family transcriptional regulator
MSRESGRAEPNAGEGQTARRATTEENLDRILSEAATLMARKGFVQTSIRDVSKATGLSLAGMYYYFSSKDDLLYLIQQRTFTSLVEAQESQAAAEEPAEQRLRRLIRSHLEFFSRHSSELKVCTFELESLGQDRYEEVEAVRRRYYRLMAGVVADLLGHPRKTEGVDVAVRHVTLFIFGMLNWVFMWYADEIDSPIEEMADRMVDMLLHGVTRMAES